MLPGFWMSWSSGTNSHSFWWLVLKAQETLGCRAAAPDLDEGWFGEAPPTKAAPTWCLGSLPALSCVPQHCSWPPSKQDLSRGGVGPRLGYGLQTILILPSPGLKAFRQQLRKNARTKGFLGLNKIKGLARQVCQPSSSSRATRGGLNAFQLPAPSPGLHGSGASSREGRSLLEEVLHQQRYARLAPVTRDLGGTHGHGDFLE